MDDAKAKRRRFHLPRWTPLFHLWVEVPFVSIRTQLMGYAMERRVFDYVVLQVKVWKWEFHFDLYGQERF